MQSVVSPLNTATGFMMPVLFGFVSTDSHECKITLYGNSVTFAIKVSELGKCEIPLSQVPG